MVEPMMRSQYCPLCGSEAESVLHLQFNKKMKLPTELEIRHCARDNFLFVGAGCQSDYDEYYQALANDSYHAEVSSGNARSPIAELQKKHLVAALGGFFGGARKVLDFGCGEACLLVELASDFPSSTFFGFDPGPAAETGSNKAKVLGLDNLCVLDLKAAAEHGPYDLVIASHVMEHLLDFDLLHVLNGLLAENGLFYAEVPDPLQYETRKRREFLYYFDRLHVNHFTPQSLARLATGYGFGYLRHFEYTFPYRDGGEYPAVGMLFTKGGETTGVSSPSILEAVTRYISQEKVRAGKVAGQFDAFKAVLVWGCGDNFYRSIQNAGPLSGLRNMVLLDRRPQEITIGGRKYATTDPQEGIRRYAWPIVVTVSERRQEIIRQIAENDPHRRVFFV